MINLCGCPRYGSQVLGSDAPAPSTQESTAAMLQAYTQNLPDLVRVSSQNILPMEQAQMDAAKVINPQQNDLATALYAKYGPILNNIGSQIAGQNQQAAVSNDAAALQKANQTGLVNTALELQKTADPEYYAQRAALAHKQNEILSSMGGGQLTPTELEEITRGVNRSNIASGNANLGGQSALINNAMQFGQAGTARRNSLSNALATTAQSLNSFRSGFDPFQVATGRTAFANTGNNLFSNQASQAFGGNTMALGQNLLNQAGENQRAAMNINANRRNDLDMFNQTFGSIMGGVGAAARGFTSLGKP